ncbi:MAG: PAS domain S-box protein, partial [Acidimicrobiales bacterium]|nr:PAS domain S-box protein [Acidimicrobiales bacterium]
MSNTEAEPLRPRQAVDRLQRRLETLADGPLDEVTLSLQARIILGQLSHHAVLLDRAGRILDSNDNLLNVTGTTRERVAGLHLWSAPWWHEGGGATDTLRFLLQQANNDEPVRALVDLQHTGEVLGRSHEVVISPVSDSGGESVFFLAEIRDVADRLAAESIIDDRARDLQAAEARYQLLVEHSSDLIGRHDLDGRYVHANGSSLTVLGRTAEEMVGQLLA